MPFPFPLTVLNFRVSEENVSDAVNPRQKPQLLLIAVLFVNVLKLEPRFEKMPPKKPPPWLAVFNVKTLKLAPESRKLPMEFRSAVFPVNVLLLEELRAKPILVLIAVLYLRVLWGDESRSNP